MLRADEDGMFPNYVLYHELVATTRPYMRNVCAVEMPWVIPILKKLENLNINKLRYISLIRRNNSKEKTSIILVMWCEYQAFLFTGNSGGSYQVEDKTEEKSSDPPQKSVDVARPPNDAEIRIQAARDRFLARKAKR